MNRHFFIILFLILSAQLFAQADKDPIINEGIGADTGIVDIHCHPSLKMYLFGAHMWKRHHTRSGDNIFQMQTDTRTLAHNSVKGFMATHYLLEKNFVRESIIRFLVPVLRIFRPSLVADVENEDYTNFAQINNMLDVMELQVRIANLKQDKVKFRIVKNYQEFVKAIKAGEMPIAHAIEGGHALGRDMAVSPKRKTAQERKMKLAEKIKMGEKKQLQFTQQEQAALTRDQLNNYKKYRSIKAPVYNRMQDGEKPETKYLQNLLALKDRGVCMMTLLHFFKNDFTHPTEGVSPDSKRFPCMKWHYNPAIDDTFLTYVGKKVVEKMLEIGMIVDLTHTNPVARNQVFAINDSMNKIRAAKHLSMRPVIFSHAGVQSVFNGTVNKNYKLYGAYDLTNDEIDNIAKCNGVIGVIPENFWLKGCDTHLKGCKCSDYRNGIKYIIETIDSIHARTHSYSNIAIGSDFDGLADAPKDLHNPSQYAALIKAMRIDGLKPEEIALITHGNALRVLRDGWGD